ncbi:MAG: metallophosphoesterase family protein [Deferribacterota bacterium]|nr:metallophosphoesterase family protein [Deferribacterota bacterium]
MTKKREFCDIENHFILNCTLIKMKNLYNCLKMRVLIISDTHVESINYLPNVIIDEASNSDIVIHCGDIVGLNLIDELKQICSTIYAVKGNMDPPEASVLPNKIIKYLSFLKVGIIHGSGAPIGIKKRILKEFDESLDIIFYGHTHIPENKLYEGIHFVNPGSVTRNIKNKFGSYGILNIKEKDYTINIKYIGQL